MQSTLPIYNTYKKYSLLDAESRSLHSLIRFLMALLVLSSSFSCVWSFSLKYGLSVRQSLNSNGCSPILDYWDDKTTVKLRILLASQGDVHQHIYNMAENYRARAPSKCYCSFREGTTTTFMWQRWKNIFLVILLSPKYA